MKFIIETEAKHKNTYKLQVTTWENDGDCYNTETFWGDLERIAKYVKWLSDYRSMNRSDNSNYIIEQYEIKYNEDLELIHCEYNTSILRQLDSFSVSYYDNLGVEHEITLK